MNWLYLTSSVCDFPQLPSKEGLDWYSDYDWERTLVSTSSNLLFSIDSWSFPIHYFPFPFYKKLIGFFFNELVISAFSLFILSISSCSFFWISDLTWALDKNYLVPFFKNCFLGGTESSTTIPCSAISSSKVLDVYLIGSSSKALN